jgi:hypothetical protein
MNKPITIEIKRQDESWDLVEVMPVWMEQGDAFVTTGSYRLCRGYPEFYSKLYDAEAMRERYLENIELQAEAHPDYLGQLHFKGIGFFEWKYEGDQLTEREVWQLVDCIQDYNSGKASTTEHGFLTQRRNAPKDIDLYFRYGKNNQTYHIRIEEMEGQFIVLINGEPAAKIECMEDWEVTGGDIYDSDLLAEIIRRIRANT